MANTRSTSTIPSSGDPSSSQSSSNNLSGGTIAGIAIGTVLAVGVVCFLLFWPQLLFAWLMKRRSRNRRSKCKDVPLKDRLPQHPGQVSGNDGSSNGADDAGSRRRRPEIVHGGRTRAQGNQIIINRPPGSPVVINNNIYVNSGDYLQPLPALSSPRNRIPQNAQGVSGTRRVPFSDPPNGGIPPQRRRRDKHSAPPPKTPTTPTAEQSDSSAFWDVGDWARSVAPGHIPYSPARRRTRSPSGRRERPLIRQADRQAPRERTRDFPGAFPEEKEVVERFRLVTAPARVHAPGAPSHGDDGFWVRDGRENGWRRRDREEREDRRERGEREERRERDRIEMEERRERDRIEKEDRREREEREERRERREREDRRERWDRKV